MFKAEVSIFEAEAQIFEVEARQNNLEGHWSLFRNKQHNWQRDLTIYETSVLTTIYFTRFNYYYLFYEI